jgi:outer membrane protein assembly factor BamB
VEVRAAGAVSSSPAVYRSTVYIEAGDAAFHAVDANTGSEKWTIKTDAPIPPDPKLMSNGKWEFEHASPVIAGDTVYFGSADGNLYAFDPATGKQQWRFRTAGRVRASPAIADGVLYVGSMDGHLYAVGAGTGTEKWKFKTAGNKYFPLGEVQSSPAIGDGIVYFGARDGALYAVDAAKGALRWKADQENFSWVISGPALYKGMVIVGTSDAQDIKAYDAKTGQRKWKAASPEPANILASPTICGDTLYIGDFYGSMLWLNAATGKLLGGFGTDSRIVSSAIVQDGVLYFGGEDDYFYALE